MIDDKRKEFDEQPEEELKPPVESKKKLDKKKEEKQSKQNILISVINYLNDNYEFRYNEFTKRPEIRKKDGDGKFEFFDERSFDNLWTTIQVDFGMNVNDADLRKIIGSMKVSSDYNPMRDFILSLPKWDRVDRFPEFLRRVQLKDESIRVHFLNTFKKWFVALVASIVDDASYNENCLVFTGNQGVGKTRFFTSLIPYELRLHYLFVGNFDPRDKDQMEYLGTKILIILDEMGTLNRTDNETMKTVMSTRYITLRRAFGRAPLQFYRHASFCGSINDDQFLTDQTGNRRWLPFAIYDIEKAEDYDIKLLYSQALAMFKEGFRTYFDADEIRQIEKYNEDFRHRPAEEELILMNYRVPNDADFKKGYGVKFLTTTDIMHSLASRDDYRKMNVNDTVLKRIARSLKKLGFKQISKRREGDEYPVKCWAVVVLEANQSDDLRKAVGSAIGYEDYGDPNEMKF